MRRFARRLFTLCSAVSLMLCVVVCVLWVRSYWVSEAVFQIVFISPWGLHERLRIVISNRGVLGFEDTDNQWRVDARGMRMRRSPGFHYVTPAEYAPARGRGVFGRLGFASDHTLTQDTVGRVGRRRYAVPYWALAAASGLAPAVWCQRRGRRRRSARLAAGLCPACGYDLRASPERCPECGAAASCHCM